MSSSRKTVFRAIAVVGMIAFLAGLLIWQEVRYQLVGECLAAGGHWDGQASRCRPIPKIYLERGLKRTDIGQ